MLCSTLRVLGPDAILPFFPPYAKAGLDGIIAAGAAGTMILSARRHFISNGSRHTFNRSHDHNFPALAREAWLLHGMPQPALREQGLAGGTFIGDIDWCAAVRAGGNEHVHGWTFYGAM